MAYSPVYSTPFIQYTEATGVNSFDVPQGYTAIIRQISVVQDIGGYIAAVFIQDSPSAPQIQITNDEAIGTVNYVAREGRWVVPGGGVITIGTTELGASFAMYVGGYLLADTIP